MEVRTKYQSLIFDAANTLNSKAGLPIPKYSLNETRKCHDIRSGYDILVAITLMAC